jgi:SpoVK/Ycf46/Vps4 family AAA+-type ATPase
VVTVATTNVTETIDPALLRPGRFDSVIEIGVPGSTARRQILRRYLRAFGEFDLARVVAATPGATGADLREIVRRAVLERGSAMTADDLFDVAATGRWRASVPTGQYL